MTRRQSQKSLADLRTAVRRVDSLVLERIARYLRVLEVDVAAFPGIVATGDENHDLNSGVRTLYMTETDPVLVY